MLPTISVMQFLAFAAYYFIIKAGMLALSTHLTNKNENSPMASALGALS